MTARTIALCLALSSLISCADRAALSSPDGKLTLNVYTTAEGQLGFDLMKDGTPLLPDSRLGLETDLRSWDDSLEIAGISDEQRIVESYAMPTGKRRLCSNEFSRKTYTVLNADGDSLLIEFMLADDGAAFRYVVPNALPGERVTGESSAYRIPDGTRRWIQTYERDGYEAFYPLATDGAPRGKWRPASLWGYPALVEPCEDVFVLLSEADIRRGHCGSYLDNGEQQTVYRVVPADICATTAGSSWESPWRVMIAGSLAQVVESTLITDLSPGCVLEDTGWIRPGIAAWIYWAHNHGSQDYRLVTQYIDLAAEMGVRIPAFSVDFTFQDGDELDLCGLKFTVLATPGHTPGGVCFLCGDSLFTGDTLFCESVGRTDFPGGSTAQLRESVKKLLALPGNLTVYPGHDEPTTLEHERMFNPFV